MARLFENFLSGTLSVDCNPADPTFQSTELQSMQAISGDTMKVILDPLGAGNGPEVVTVTAHTAASQTATITRAQEGTSDVLHTAGRPWVAAFTADDLTNIQAANLTGTASVNTTGNAGTVTVDATTSVTTAYPMLVESASGSLLPQTDPGLTYNASTNVLTASGGFTGDLTGDVTGTADTAAEVEVDRTITGSGWRVALVDASANSKIYDDAGALNYNADTGQLTVGGELEATALDINGNGDITGTLAIGTSGGGDAIIYFHDDNTNTERTFKWDDSANAFQMEDNGGTMRTVWTSGTDGAGSGLDADLLDGVQGSNFVRADIGDTMNGNYTITGILTMQNEIRAHDGTAGDPGLAFSGEETLGFFRAGTNDMRFACAGGSRIRFRNADFLPNSSGYDCGNASIAWDDVYGVNAYTQTSDERLKERVGESLGLDFVDRLEPFAFKWTEDGNRVHQGLGAQSVAAVLEAIGEDPGDHALWVKVQEDEDGNPVEDGRESLRYAELIPVLVNAVQELSARVRELEG